MKRLGDVLGSRKKLLLSAAGLIAVAAPIVFGQVNATPSRTESQTLNTTAGAPVFDVATIKPNKSGGDMFRPIEISFRQPRFAVKNVSLAQLIRFAYLVNPEQILVPAGWIKSEKYDVEAKEDSSVFEEMQKLSPDQAFLERRHMIQALLADRFHLIVHWETKELPVYALVIAKNGPKLHEAKPGDTYANGFKRDDGHPYGPGITGNGNKDWPLTGQGVPIADLADRLWGVAGLERPVIDKTGIKGNYDFTLRWTKENQNPIFNGSNQGPPAANAPSPDLPGPSLFTAIQQQLGLKLQPEKDSIEVIVIDHAERPSEN